MQVSVCPVRGRLPESAVRRAAVVEDVAELFDDARQQTFIDMARREVRLTEVRVFVVVIQL